MLYSSLASILPSSLSSGICFQTLQHIITNSCTSSKKLISNIPATNCHFLSSGIFSYTHSNNCTNSPGNISLVPLPLSLQVIWQNIYRVNSTFCLFPPALRWLSVPREQHTTLQTCLTFTSCPPTSKIFYVLQSYYISLVCSLSLS